jgi:hypothetical protein
MLGCPSGKVGLSDSRKNFQAEMEAGRPVDGVFFKPEAVIKDIVHNEHSAAV